MTSPIMSVRLIALLLALLFVSAPLIGDKAKSKHPKPGETEVITILNPRWPSSPGPPDPTPDGTGPKPGEATLETVGCWLLRSASITGSATTLASALAALGVATVDEADAICSS